MGAVTDSVGNYFLSSIPTGKYILRVDYIGYESQTKEIYITLYDLDEKNETGSVLIDKLGVEESAISNDAKFIDDLGADSLDTVELIMQFEEEFNLEIPDEDAETITTVGKAIDYISSKL